jgi:hypothetical protein
MVLGALSHCFWVEHFIMVAIHNHLFEMRSSECVVPSGVISKRIVQPEVNGIRGIGRRKLADLRICSSEVVCNKLLRHLQCPWSRFIEWFNPNDGVAIFGISLRNYADNVGRTKAKWKPPCFPFPARVVEALWLQL